MIIIVPVFTPVQAVAVDDVVAVGATPAVTVAGTRILQLLASRIVMKWVPAETPLKVKGLAPGTGIPPSSDQVNGATPVSAVIVMLPLFCPGQDVAVVVALPDTPFPKATFAGTRILQLKLSRIVTL